MMKKYYLCSVLLLLVLGCFKSQAQHVFLLNDGAYHYVSCDTSTAGDIYDGGGLAGNYSSDTYSFITLYFPVGDTLRIYGSYQLDNNSNRDYFTIYGRDDRSFWGTGTIDTFFINGYCSLFFYTDYENNFAGLDLHYELRPSQCANPIGFVNVLTMQGTSAYIDWATKVWGGYKLTYNGRDTTVLGNPECWLTGLERNSTYTVAIVDTADADNENACTHIFNITTDTCNEKIYSFSAIDLQSTSARLVWQTDEIPDTYILSWGGRDTAVSSNEFLITGLSPNTDYSFTIKSVRDTCCSECFKNISFHTPCFKAGITGLRPLIGNDTITLTADSADAYLWSTGATTRSITVTEAGFYTLTVFTQGGCPDSLRIGVSDVKLDIDLDIPTDICSGQTFDLHVGLSGTANVRINPNEMSSMADPNRIFLPDGRNCDPTSDHGCSYRSTLEFNGFGNNELVTSPNDIRYVMLNIEHSYIGDIYINITCPNGQNADVLRFSGNGSSECNADIDGSHRGWAAGSNCTACMLGEPIDLEDTNAPCDSTAENNQAGIGWRYCWSNSYDAGYTYAPGDALIYRMDNVIFSAIDSSNLAAGTNFYHPDESFASLVGCPMNGEWFIEVIDGWGMDNGYIFGWELALNPNRLMRNTYRPTVASAVLDGDFFSRTTDTTFNITCPAGLTHDTTVLYTVTIIDSLGNTFDTTFTISFHPSRTGARTIFVVENDLPLTIYGQSFTTEVTDYPITIANPDGCDSTIFLTINIAYNTSAEFQTSVCENMLPFVWHGQTFNATEVRNITMVNHMGADSLVTLSVTVLPWSPAAISGARDMVAGDNLTLTAAPAASYLWSTGDTTQAITIHNAGTYTLIVNPNTICAESTQVNIFHSVTRDTTICSGWLPLIWNGAIYLGDSTRNDTIYTTGAPDTIVTYIVNVIPSPEAHISGRHSLIGMNDSIVLTASAADAYRWSTGDTTQCVGVTDTGEYTLTVVTQGLCEDSVTVHVQRIHPTIDLSVPDTICAGDTHNITAGMGAAANVRINPVETTLSDGEQIFLPDGENCDPTSDHGCSYRSGLTYEGFSSSQTITSANDIRYVMLNIEHSYMGDLYINITCPNGQNADILHFFGSGSSACTSTIGSDHIGWQPGNNGTRTHLGLAYSMHDSAYPCDPTRSYNAPGIGWRYCWSDNTQAGYTYANDGGYIYRSQNHHIASSSYGTATTADSSNMAAGTQFYHPDESFDSLVGCPINGTWYIEVVDGWNIDNGYIFGWELALDPDLVASVGYSPNVSHADLVGDFSSRDNDTTFTISPPNYLPNDTTVNYTVTIYDSTGVSFDTTFTITFLAHPTRTANEVVVENNLPIVRYGRTFTQEVQDVEIVVPNPNGCDSLVYFNLSVIPNTYATVYDTICENRLPHTWLGITFTAAGTQQAVIPNALGADSIITMHLFVNPNTYATYADTCVENSLPHWYNGLTAYGDIANAQITIPNAQGCDSVISYSLKVWYNQVANIDSNICDNQLAGFVWNGQTPSLTPIDGSQPGTTNPVQHESLAATLLTTHGADSSVTLSLNVYPTYHFDFYDTICDNMSYAFEGTTYSTTGVYDHMLTTALGGCDSLRTLRLMVYPTYVFESYDTIFEGDTSFFHDNFYTQTGDYSLAFATQSGCDSSYVLHLIAKPLHTKELRESICEGMEYIFMGRTLTETGIYVDTLYALNPSDGDTVVTLYLTVLPHPEVTIAIADTVCSPAHYTLEGFSTSAFLRWTSVPYDTLLNDYFNNSVVQVNPRDTTIYYLYADYREDSFCPSFDSIVLAPVTPVRAIIDVKPVYITLEERNIEAYNHSTGPYFSHRWGVLYDGITAFIDSTASLQITAPNYVDTTCIWLSVKSRTCADTDTVCIPVRTSGIFIPNIFTPTASNNQVFKVIGPGVIDFEIWIYDRRGDIVYHSTDIHEGWDGKSGGQLCPQASYVYKVRYSDVLTPYGYQTTTGTVTLIH